MPYGHTPEIVNWSSLDIYIYILFTEFVLSNLSSKFSKWISISYTVMDVLWNGFYSIFFGLYDGQILNSWFSPEYRVIFLDIIGFALYAHNCLKNFGNQQISLLCPLVYSLLVFFFTPSILFNELYNESTNAIPILINFFFHTRVV